MKSEIILYSWWLDLLTLKLTVQSLFNQNQWLSFSLLWRWMMRFIMLWQKMKIMNACDNLMNIDYDRNFDVQLRLKLLPRRNHWILKTHSLVLVCQPINLFLVSALREYIIGLILVECATHSTISWEHGEYTGAAQSSPLPKTTFYHSYKKFYLHNIIPFIHSYACLPYPSSDEVTFITSKQGSWEYHNNSNRAG